MWSKGDRPTFEDLSIGISTKTLDYSGPNNSVLERPGNGIKGFFFRFEKAFLNLRTTFRWSVGFEGPDLRLMAT